MSLRREGEPRVELVPRLDGQGYSPELIAERRRWLEAKTGAALPHLGQFSQPGEELRGNVENPIGMAQVPLGVAGPLLIDGEDARGTFYVPLATSEGALVRSYERGMVALTYAGGVTVRVQADQNRISPSFYFTDLRAAHEFVAWVEAQETEIRRCAEATTRHGRLLRLRCHPVGREVVVDFDYSTADASGMNMMTAATDAACRWIVAASTAEGYHLYSGAESEKHASATLMAGGKGKWVSAGALLPERVLRAVLHAGAAGFARLWQGTMTGHL